MAIRGALGAQRARLVRLSLIESALLGLIGGVLGVAFAYGCVRALIFVDPASIPRAKDVVIDGRMLLFAAAVSFVSVTLFGLIPALRGAATDLQSTLRESSQSTSGSPARLWFRRALVAVEVALAVVLVVGAGLMVRSIDRLFTVDPGFKPDGLVMTAVALPAGGIQGARPGHQLLRDRARTRPRPARRGVGRGDERRAVVERHRRLGFRHRGPPRARGGPARVERRRHDRVPRVLRDHGHAAGSRALLREG